jgi:phosphotransferase family enzyme
MSGLYPDSASMFAALGITASETPIAHDGYSGATMSRIEQDGRAYIVKRVSRTTDWIIQMTSDHAMREAQIAASDVLVPLAPALRTPSIAAARDGDGFALLMRDLTPHLLPPEGVLAPDTWELILRALAKMHGHFWEAPIVREIGWCGLDEYLLFLSEPAGRRLHEAGLMEVGFGAGWERFHAAVPRVVSDLVRRLHADPSSIVAACNRLPRTLLHHDVKTANIAIDGRTVWLFDWALAGYGPAGCDLGLLLAINSTRLLWTLEETAARYRESAHSGIGARFDAAQWPRQLAVAHVTGLMLLGWSKQGEELEWWCERAMEAQSLLRL